MTAALSYLGYIAVRIGGPSRGALVTGLTGGIVSSTSVTVTLARTAAGGEPVRPLVAGAATAAMVSVLRVSVIVLLVRPGLIPPVAPPLSRPLPSSACRPCCWWPQRPGMRPAAGLPPAIPSTCCIS